MDILLTQQLLERVTSLLRSKNRTLLLEHGMQLVQLEALQYLSRCNRYSNTPMAVTEFLGQTKGSVSQSLKVLENKQLIVKQHDPKDKRVTRLLISPKGQELVDGLLPSNLLRQAGELMGEEGVGAINTSLASLLSMLQQANRYKTFGQCITCRHNMSSAGGGYTCGLTLESLSGVDVGLICREHKTCD